MSTANRPGDVLAPLRPGANLTTSHARDVVVAETAESAASAPSRHHAASADCDIQGTHSIFETPAWLDAVAPGAWSAAEVRDGDAVTARMPYMLRSRLGTRILTVPPLTPWLGPWIAPLSGKYQTRLSREHELLQELIGRLPPYHAAVVPAAPEQTNMLPFHWRGFRLCASYTYRIPLGDSLATISAGAKQETRKTIKKARERVEIVAGGRIEEIDHLLSATYRRQGLATPALIGTIDRILTAPELQHSRELLVARDEKARPHAFALLIFDARHCFYVIGGADPELRASGAQTFLFWTAIERSKGRSAVFDFEGSMKNEIERAFRAFGAVQTPQITAFSENSVRGVAYRLAAAAKSSAARTIASRRIGRSSESAASG